MDIFQIVSDWHREFGVDPPDRPTFFGYPDELQVDMLHEEIDEMLEALADRDMVSFVDGGCDAIWILCGMLYRAGVDLRPAFAEIARSNHTKELSKDSGSTKIKKGPNYSAPDLKPALKSMGWEGDD